MVDGGPLTGWLKEGTRTGKQAQRELGSTAGPLPHGRCLSQSPADLTLDASCEHRSPALPGATPDPTRPCSSPRRTTRFRGAGKS